MSKRLESLKTQEKKLLIPFITAGDLPDEQTLALMHQLVEKGADVVELGMPFSDPMADGPVIQRSSERALARGTTLKTVLELVAQFRQKNQITPIVLMGYANPIERYGWASFVPEAAKHGVDGLLLVDYPPEAMARWAPLFEENGMSAIYLVAPTTRPERMHLIAKAAKGFIYFVALKGVTGSNRIDLSAIQDQVGRLKRIAQVPVVAGFGIRDRDTATEMAALTDGIVIGSRIIELIETSPTQTDTSEALAWFEDIRKALDSTGVGA